MRKPGIALMFAIAVMGGALSGIARADNSVEIYGLLNSSYQYERAEIFGENAEIYGNGEVVRGPGDETYYWAVNSNASRLGVRGEIDIASDLKAVFDLQYEIFVNGYNTEAPFKSRNIYGGFQGNWGSVLAGRIDSTLKMVRHYVDIFIDLYLGDMNDVLIGNTRINYVLLYQSPTLSNTTITFQVAPEDLDNITCASDNDNCENTVFGVYSGSIEYDGDGFIVALAANVNVNRMDVYRALGEWTFGDLRLGALAQIGRESDSGAGLTFGRFQDIVVTAYSSATGAEFDRQYGMLLSTEYIKGNYAYKWQAGYSVTEGEIPTTGADSEISTFQLNMGVDYLVSDNSALFSYCGYIRARDEEDLPAFGSNEATGLTCGVGAILEF